LDWVNGWIKALFKYFPGKNGNGVKVGKVWWLELDQSKSSSLKTIKPLELRLLIH
jgi:hypothetical protein